MFANCPQCRFLVALADDGTMPPRCPNCAIRLREDVPEGGAHGAPSPADTALPAGADAAASHRPVPADAAAPMPLHADDDGDGGPAAPTAMLQAADAGADATAADVPAPPPRSAAARLADYIPWRIQRKPAAAAALPMPAATADISAGSVTPAIEPSAAAGDRHASGSTDTAHPGPPAASSHAEPVPEAAAAATGGETPDASMHLAASRETAGTVIGPTAVVEDAGTASALQSQTAADAPAMQATGPTPPAPASVTFPPIASPEPPTDPHTGDAAHAQPAAGDAGNTDAARAVSAPAPAPAGVVDTPRTDPAPLRTSAPADAPEAVASTDAIAHDPASLAASTPHATDAAEDATRASTAAAATAVGTRAGQPAALRGAPTALRGDGGADDAIAADGIRPARIDASRDADSDGDAGRQGDRDAHAAGERRAASADAYDAPNVPDALDASVEQARATDATAAPPSAPPSPLPRVPASPSFARRAVARAPVDRRRALLRGGAIGALALLLLVQLLLADRAVLAADARWRPLVAAACGALRCTLPPWREPHAFQVLERDVRAHPTRAGVLRVSARMRNDARWAQPWPLLRLTLSDVHGRAVASRAFRPREYLGGAPTQSALASGHSAALVMEIVEPGPQAVAFTFDFE